MTTHRLARLSAALLVAAATAACSDSVTAPAPNGPSFAKSGTAPSGGSTSTGGGTNSGGSGGVDNTGGSTGTQSSPPVAPSYTARIDSIGIVPTALYYGSPSQWTVGGYVFEANSLTHLKPTNGPLVVGACVSVTFSVTYTGAYLASELRTEQPSKCGG